VLAVVAAEVRAVVRFPYSAANEDELTLHEGEIVTVLDQNIVDNGWWKGELKGRVGVFPDNFVELLPSDEVSNGGVLVSRELCSYVVRCSSALLCAMACQLCAREMHNWCLNNRASQYLCDKLCITVPC